MWPFNSEKKNFSPFVSKIQSFTFLFVERGQEAVVSADLEVNLLLHPLRDCPLWDYYADTSLNGAQDAAVRVEDTTGCCNYSVAFIFVFIVIQSTGAERQEHAVVVFLHPTDQSLLWCEFGLRLLLPHRDGLRDSSDVVVLVLGAMVHGAGERVHTTIVV